MPTDAEFEAAMRRERERKRKVNPKPKPTKPNLRNKIKRRMERIDEITRDGTTPDHTKRV